MKTLLTGATGFVGTAVARRLETDGRDWRALVRDPAKAARRGIPESRIHRGDLRSDPSAALEGVDRVIHVAGLVRGREQDLMAVNAEATRRLAARFEELAPGGRLVLVSSLAAAGPSEDGSRSAVAHDEAVPVSSYGRSKLAGERAVAEVSPNWITLRPGVVYGPWDSDVFVLFRMAQKGVMPLVGRRVRYSLIHVDDLADAIVEALDAVPAAASRAYPVVHPEALAQEDWLRRVGESVGTEPRLLPLPKAAAWISAAASEAAAAVRRRPALFGFDKFREMKQGSWVGDPEPARSTLGWAARIGHDEGFRRTAEWYRQQGWLPARDRAREGRA